MKRTAWYRVGLGLASLVALVDACNDGGGTPQARLTTGAGGDDATSGGEGPRPNGDEDPIDAVGYGEFTGPSDTGKRARQTVAQYLADKHGVDGTPGHCHNGVLDGSLGEVAADCGGPCGCRGGLRFRVRRDRSELQSQ